MTIGENQFAAFTRERIIERTKPIDDTLQRNTFVVFGATAVRNISKNKQQMVSLKQDMQLFARLYLHAKPDMETLVSSLDMIISLVCQRCLMGEGEVSTSGSKVIYWHA